MHDLYRIVLLGGGSEDVRKRYTLYITYTPYYRTPRLYLSGYVSPSEPLPLLRSRFLLRKLQSRQIALCSGAVASEVEEDR